MDLWSMMSWFQWEFLKQKLLQVWISPNDIQWVDFNNINDLNQLADKLVPTLLKNNPMMKEIIKQNAWMFWAEKAKQVAEVIDMN
jgi:hypothetical protein